MHFKKLVSRYRQFGGFRLVIEYAKLGVLLPAAKAVWRFTVKGSWFLNEPSGKAERKVGVFQCCKALYPVVLQRFEPFLKERFQPVMEERIAFYREKGIEHHKSKIGWFCWLQGLSNAPEIVKACYHSIVRHLTDREIKVIDSSNWKEYVDLPEEVVRKWEQGRIPAALFSDLLRLELLIKYGGTWIDSTVLCTGFNDSQNNNEKYLDADLFVFQYNEQGSREVSISNWFITASTNNEVLMVLRDMLMAYWREYDCTLDYYMFHLFFSMIAEEYPEETSRMPYGYSPNSLVLLHHWGEKFNEKKWNRLTKQVGFHKLAFRIGENLQNDKSNYYNHILRTYKNE